MARKRMVNPDFWNDEKLATVSRDARLTFIATWNHSDDYGVVKGHPVWLKSVIYPYDEKLRLETFEKWVKELIDIKVIRPFVANGELFYYIRTFSQHQTINKPSKQRNPEPPQELTDSVTPLPEECSSSVVVLPTEEEEEEEEEVKKKESKNLFYDTVYLTEDQHQKLNKKFGHESTLKAITILNNYKSSSGKKYKSDYHAILLWVMEKAGGKPISPITPPKDTICPDCGKPIKAGVCECEPISEEEKAEGKKKLREFLEGMK